MVKNEESGGSTRRSLRGPLISLLRRLLAQQRRAVLWTYGLLVAEIGLNLLRPLVWGLAIDSLLVGNIRGLWLAAAQHVLAIGTGQVRRRVDVRTFSRVYQNLAEEIVAAQRSAAISVTEVGARVSLAKDFVTFFDVQLPNAFLALASLVGGCVALALYDIRAGLIILVLSVPLILLNRRYARVADRLNRGLNNRLEREIDVIERAEPRKAKFHFASMARWTIRLTDAETNSWSITDFTVLGMMLGIMWMISADTGMSAGSIAAVLSYLWMVMVGYGQIPTLIQEWTKLSDIATRLATGRSRSGLPGDSALSRLPVDPVTVQDAHTVK